ncbi:hypothetical protein [Dokdonella sp.]|uniref:hypothetical protein n=1 Tax=Dokdonella sp. TaxID=2291710 RepID=UPI0031C458ED|nr:hypothetical protein [Dokdonella sp.]
MTSAPTIAFDYLPSRTVAWVAASGVACALFAVAASGLAPLARAALALAVLVLAAGGLRRFLKPAFRRIAWQPEGWLLVALDGSEHAAELVAQRRLGTLLALDFRCAGRVRFRPLFARDNLDRETWRRLVLLLARAEVGQPA